MVRLQNSCFSEKIRLSLLFLTAQLAVFIPKKILKKKILIQITNTSLVDSHFFSSGRAAIKSIGDCIYDNDNDNILIPEYLCNVVQSALEASSCRCTTYPLNNDLEPDILFLVEKIKSGNYNGVVIAPIFGSQCGLNWWLSPQAIKLVNTCKINLIFDFCQDISLEKKFNILNVYKKAYIVFSFNDKSIPGLMGGLLIGNNLSNIQKVNISIKQSIEIRLHAILKVINLFRPSDKVRESKYDYSYCKRFPYTHDAIEISGYQLVLAFLGLNALDKYNRKKSKIRNQLEYRHLPESKTSAYVISSMDIVSLKLKNSYALHDNPSVSLRPDLKIYHVKGFDDC